MDRPFTGLTASIKINNELLAYASGLDLNLEKDIIEVISFGASYKEKVPAIKDWSATIDGTVALQKGNSQEALFNAYANNTLVEVGIYLSERTYFSGSAYIQSINISGAPDDKLSLSCELAGSGATVLTLPNVYDITISEGDNGNISPLVSKAEDGEKLSFRIVADSGYKIATLTVDSENAMANLTNKTESGTDVLKGTLEVTVTADTAIAVTFAEVS